jgi:hypothetical protein
MNDPQTAVGKAKAVSNVVKTEAVSEGRTGGNLRSPKELHQDVAVVAYYLAEGRNFEPGHEMEDWLNAEAEVLAELEGLKGFPA